MTVGWMLLLDLTLETQGSRLAFHRQEIQYE